MNNKYIFAAILILSGFFNISSQSLRIIDIDAKEFPLVNVLIEINSKNGIDFSEVKIIENTESKNFNIDSSFSISPPNMISLLVDPHILKTNNELIELIGRILENKKNNKNLDSYNIIIATNKNDSNCIFPLSLEYSQAQNIMFLHFKSFCSSSLNIDYPPIDLSCSLDSTIQFITYRNTKPNNKFVFLFKSPKSTCIDLKTLEAKAEANLINMSVFEIKNSTNFNMDSILGVIQKHTDIKETSNSNKNSYILSFYTSQNKNKNNFQIHFKGQKYNCTFLHPNDNGLSFGKLLSIIIILIIALFGIIIYLRQKRYTDKPNLISEPFKKETYKDDFQKTENKKEKQETAIPYLTIDINNKVEKFEIKKLRTNIGRHSDNDILIPHLTISNHHCTITNEGGVFYIQDNESTNGIFVNDLKISKSKLNFGDVIRMGVAKITLTY